MRATVKTGKTATRGAKGGQKEGGLTGGGFEGFGVENAWHTVAQLVAGNT